MRSLASSNAESGEGSVAAAITPLLLVTGFLGSGKTTLINRLLHLAGPPKLGVVVNEFGQIGIDGALLAGTEILELANGCVCCVKGTELWESALELVDRAGAQVLIVETSGLVEPALLLEQYALLPRALRGRLELRGLLCVVDALHVQTARLRRREVEQQLRLADRLLITKSDVCRPEDLLAVHQLLDELGASTDRASITPTTPSGEVRNLLRWALLPRKKAPPRRRLPRDPGPGADAHVSGAQDADARGTGARVSDAHVSGAHLSGARAADAHVSDAHVSDAHGTSARVSPAHSAEAHGAEAQVLGTHGADAQSPGAHGSGARGSDAHGLDGHGADGHDSDARGADAHGSDAHAHGSAAHGSAAHGLDGHGADGHGHNAHGSCHAGRQLVAVSLQEPLPLLATPLQQLLRELPGEVLRVKGLVRLLTAGADGQPELKLWVLQLAGRVVELVPATEATASVAPAGSTLVFIGEELDESWLRLRLSACRSG